MMHRSTLEEVCKYERYQYCHSDQFTSCVSKDRLLVKITMMAFKETTDNQQKINCWGKRSGNKFEID